MEQQIIKNLKNNDQYRFFREKMEVLFGLNFRFLFNLDPQEIINFINNSQLKQNYKGQKYEFSYQEIIERIKKIGLEKNRKNILSKTYSSTMMRGSYCPDAIWKFEQCLTKGSGTRVIDSNGKILYLKDSGARVVLNISSKDIGDWDDFTQLMTNVIPPIHEDEDKNLKIYHMPFAVNFKSLEKTSQYIGYDWFRKYPEIVFRLCEYAAITMPKEINSLENIKEPYLFYFKDMSIEKMKAQILKDSKTSQ